MSEFNTVEKILLTLVVICSSPIFLVMNLYRFLGNLIEGIYLIWAGKPDAQG